MISTLSESDDDAFLLVLAGRARRVAHHACAERRRRALGFISSPAEVCRQWLLGFAYGLLLLPEPLDCTAICVLAGRRLERKTSAVAGAFGGQYFAGKTYQRAKGRTSRRQLH